MSFDVAVKPNDIVKEIRQERRYSFNPEILETRATYWPVFEKFLRAEPGLANVITRFGGRLGHLHILPNSVYPKVPPAIFCNAYLVAPASDNPRAGVWCGYSAGKVDPEQQPFLDQRLDPVKKAAEIAGVWGERQALLSSDADMQAAAKDHVARVAEIMRLLSESFGSASLPAGGADCQG